MTLSGALRDAVPFQCRKHFPNYEENRRELTESVKTRLFNDNKRLVKIRFLGDGWVADWEEIQSETSSTFTRENQSSSSIGASGTQPREVPQSAIGHARFNPINLTFWDGDDTKEEVASSTPALKTEPDMIITDLPLVLSEASNMMIVDGDFKEDYVSTPLTATEEFHDRPPTSEVTLRPRRRTPTSPSYNRLRQRSPRPNWREQRPDSRSEYRYVRVDQPGSLQLHRVPASRLKSMARHGGRIHREPLRRDPRDMPGRSDRWRSRDDDDRDYDRSRRRRYDSPRASGHSAVEDQTRHSRVLEIRNGERLHVEERDPITTSLPDVDLEDQTMHPNESATPQLDLAEEGALLSFSNIEEDDENPFPPEELFIPDDQDIHIQEPSGPDLEVTGDNDMEVDLATLENDSRPIYTSFSSSEDEDSSDESEVLSAPLPRVKGTMRQPVPETQNLLASIALAAVRDVLFTPSVIPEPASRPPHSQKPIERKAPNATPRIKSAPERKPDRPLAETTKAGGMKSATKHASGNSSTKTTPSRLSMRYKQAETIKLPKPDYARARRLLAPIDGPVACVSMPGDVQFIRSDERTRLEGWSLPAPARPKDEIKKRAYVVSDACLLGNSNIVMVYETGPHPASLVYMPNDTDDIPSRHHLSHRLVPASSDQRRHILSSVCALDNQRFFTGGIDKRILLWKVNGLEDGPQDNRSGPKVSINNLDISHAASVRALAYNTSRQWLVSAAGAKLAVTDMSTGKPILSAGKQKWASNDVFNVHFHARDRNMLLVETGDLDKQARIYDLRRIQQTEVTPERLIGSTETGAISQFVRGDWAKSLIVRPSSQNMVKVWDMRQPDRVLSEHTLSHGVTHCIFMDDCRTIAATGEHFVTYLDAGA